HHRPLPSFPTRRSSDLEGVARHTHDVPLVTRHGELQRRPLVEVPPPAAVEVPRRDVRPLELGLDPLLPLQHLEEVAALAVRELRSEEHTSELQSRENLV